MKAYVIERAGGPEVLQLQDIPRREAGPNELRIRVRAFGLNRAETYLRAGRMGEITAPRVPGIEAVGEVIADASGQFRVGQRVATAMGGLQFGRPGSYAEEVTVLRDNVVDLGDTSLSWAELAALPEAYLTVWGALTRRLAIQKGQTLLVRGATSSVGLAAIAYAKWLGLKVIATSRSSDNLERLHSIGADAALVDDGAIADQVRDVASGGVDAALEVVGAATLRDTIRAVRPFGGVAVIGLLGGPPVLENFHLMQDLPGAINLAFFPSGLFGTDALPLGDAPLAAIAHDMAEGRIPSLVSRIFDFGDVPVAHGHMESNRGLGKLVVQL
ncbi:zinc-binding dehydrogenase [Rhizobium sp. C4]|uniref:zinc-binding dehydrogenase n=1 Tax=Rhizobium sp. C4 TaxID=1349800 RepID=UPI001E325B38|nr:zinc-binding dehydrogenase [Rhizobium sp. C4]MCD2176157.1 zinc-binding dehydrogenase [Rhizobium sp. C4]